MDMYLDSSTEEILAEEDEIMTRGSFYRALAFLRFNGWYILIALLGVYHLWKHVIIPLLAKWRKIKEDDKKTMEAKKDPDVYINREEGRRAAIERFQQNYNEDLLRMKKIEEEKEERKRQKYISDRSHISTGRKLNE